jgi:hypothetical protein
VLAKPAINVIPVVNAHTSASTLSGDRSPNYPAVEKFSIWSSSWRNSLAVAVIALAAAGLHLLASATTQSGVAGRNALMRAAEVVAQSPEARANFALLGDKRILFHPAGDGFVMFGIVRRSWVVLGDPIGPFARWRDLLCQLATDATSHGGWPVFFGVGEAAAQICSKLGFAVRRIGDQAVVPLDRFASEKLSPDLQEAHRQIASLGCQFEVIASESVPALIHDLCRYPSIGSGASAQDSAPSRTLPSVWITSGDSRSAWFDQEAGFWRSRALLDRRAKRNSRSSSSDISRTRRPASSISCS